MELLHPLVQQTDIELGLPFKLDDPNYIPPSIEDQAIEVVYWIYGWPYFAFKYFWENSYLLPDENGVAFGATFDHSFTLAVSNIEHGKNSFFNGTQLVLDALNFSYIFWWIGVFGAFPYYLILAIPHSPIIAVVGAVAAVVVVAVLAVAIVAVALVIVAAALLVTLPFVIVFGPGIGIIYGVYYLFDWLLNEPDLDPNATVVDQNGTVPNIE